MTLLLLEKGGWVPLVNLQFPNSIYHDISQQGVVHFFEMGAGE
jgi:hypothetical protein